MNTTLILPSAMYNQVVIKSLYLAIQHDCLPQFLASNQITNLTELLNQPLEDYTLLGLLALNGDDINVLSLIDLGADPMNYSRIMIDDNENLILIKDPHEGQYVFDLAIIARTCCFETYTQVIDRLSIQNLNITELIEDFIVVQMEAFDKYLEYLLKTLRNKDRLDLLFQPKYNHFLRKVYAHHPESFKLLTEYGLTLETPIDGHTKVSDLIK
jgi:hypothetical protein